MLLRNWKAPNFIYFFYYELVCVL